MLSHNAKSIFVLGHYPLYYLTFCGSLYVYVLYFHLPSLISLLVPVLLFHLSTLDSTNRHPSRHFGVQTAVRKEHGVGWIETLGFITALSLLVLPIQLHHLRFSKWKEVRVQGCDCQTLASVVGVANPTRNSSVASVKRVHHDSSAVPAPARYLTGVYEYHRRNLLTKVPGSFSFTASTAAGIFPLPM